MMQSIRSSSDLKNNYEEVSEFWHKNNEPVCINKNGKGDLAVMSIETYEKLVGKFEFYALSDKGMDALKKNKARPLKDALDDIKIDL